MWGEGLSSKSETRVIEGDILFEDLQSPFSGATVHVRLEDVSLADAPSKVLSEVVLHDVSVNVKSFSVPFSIRIPALDERSMYSLMVHVDVSGSGTVTKGDYLTMENYPVPLPPGRGRVRIRIRPV